MRSPAALLLCALLPGIAQPMCRHGVDGSGSTVPQPLRIASTPTGFVIAPMVPFAPRISPAIPIGSGLKIDRALFAGPAAPDTAEIAHADK